MSRLENTVMDFCIVTPRPEVEEPQPTKICDISSSDSDDEGGYDHSAIKAYLAKIKAGIDIDEPSVNPVTSIERYKVDMTVTDYHSDPEVYPDNHSGPFVNRGPQVQLYWNLYHCSIPEGAHLLDLRRKIKIVLHGLGIHGFLHIRTYGGQQSNDVVDFPDSSFLHTPFPLLQPRGWSIDQQMCVDILSPGGLGKAWHIDRRVFVVIASLSPEMKRVLYYIHNKCQLTLLTIDPQVDLLGSTRSLLEKTNFVSAPFYVQTRPPTYPCLRTIPAKGFEAGVFWDSTDCPFPLSWSPDSIYNRIKGYFSKRNRMSREMFLSAYVDDGKMESLCEFPETPQINFIPAGYCAEARHERMLNDVLLWMLHRPQGAHLLIAGKITRKMRNVLESLEEYGCGVIIMMPKKDDTPAPENHDWPRGYLWEAYSFGLCRSRIRSRKRKDKKKLQLGV